MNPKRANAFKMRIAGKSYNEINAALGIPKSTLSGWFSHLVMSDKAEARLKARTTMGTRHAFLKRNKLQTRHAEVRAKHAREKGRQNIRKLTRKDLEVIGAVLYWAEGYKRLHIRDGKERMGHSISFVNSDPEMIQIFIRFLCEVMTVDTAKIILSMRLYAHIREDVACAYWMTCTGLPRTQFRKTTYLVSAASKGVRPYNRLPWGTLQVQVFNTQKFHQLLGMIEGVKSRLCCDTIPALPG